MKALINGCIRTTLAGGLASLGLLVPTASSAVRTPTVQVVARGLNAPKYPTLGPGGVYVPESGGGGRRCVVGVAGLSVTQVCAGPSGSIIRIAGDRISTLERGLASASVASTHDVSGVVSIGFAGGHMAVLFDDGGVGPTGVSAIASPFGARFGKLDLAPTVDGGPLRVKADIAAFAATHPQDPLALGGVPGETLYDSDPHDMVAYRGGFAIADAAANDVVWVHRSGQVTVLGRLPTLLETAPAGLFGPGTPALRIQAQAVPSCVAVGPNGALYVGILRGIPSRPGTAEVARIVPGQAPQPVVTGLTRVSDIAFDPEGRLDILESNIAGGEATTATTGALLQARLGRSAPTARVTNLHVPGLRSPIGLAITKAGVAYITNDTSTPGGAEVIAVTGLG